MTLRSALAAVGKTLEHVAADIAVGVKIAAPAIDLFDPPLGPVIAALEGVLGAVPASGAITAEQLQMMSQAVAAGYAAGLKAAKA